MINEGIWEGEEAQWPSPLFSPVPTPHGLPPHTHTTTACHHTTLLSLGRGHTAGQGCRFGASI